jgi:hypothetical protein
MYVKQFSVQGKKKKHSILNFEIFWIISQMFWITEVVYQFIYHLIEPVKGIQNL